MKRRPLRIIWIDEDTHLNIKTLAAKKGVPMKGLLREVFKQQDGKKNDNWRFF